MAVIDDAVALAVIHAVAGSPFEPGVQPGGLPKARIPDGAPHRAGHGRLAIKRE
jgi:hypothetical protein